MNCVPDNTMSGKWTEYWDYYIFQSFVLHKHNCPYCYKEFSILLNIQKHKYFKPGEPDSVSLINMCIFNVL